MTFIVKSKSHYAQSGANIFLGNEATIHPNYSLPSGSGPDLVQGLGLVGTGTGNFYRSLIVKKAVYRLRLENLDTFAKVMNFIAIPFASTGSLGANYGYNLAGSKFKVTSIILSRTTEAGATKSLVLVIEPWRVEGFSNYDLYASNSNYWATGALRGTNYTNVYCQQVEFDETANSTSGVDVNYSADFEVELRTENPILRV